MDLKRIEDAYKHQSERHEREKEFHLQEIAARGRSDVLKYRESGGKIEFLDMDKFNHLREEMFLDLKPDQQEIDLYTEVFLSFLLIEPPWHNQKGLKAKDQNE